MNNTTNAEPVDHGLTERGHHPRLARPHGDDQAAILAAEHAAAQLRSAGQPFGARGKPFDRGSPFYLGVMLSAGAAVTYGAVRVLGSASAVLVLVGAAMFVALGLWAIARFLVGFAWRDATVVGPLRTEQVLAVVVLAIAIAGFVERARAPLAAVVERRPEGEARLA